MHHAKIATVTGDEITLILIRDDTVGVSNSGDLV